ncbi:16S rRNA (uracil(1498)-N(3))-methyltransferase [Carnobacteriaceae bacterium zg-84]|uniref:16S rRNA (uracil(1498)-N(3))-methyltransferase n=1 Tax=Granulicatella sp. zg-84 TaxID=2678503 RepID=UPI0013C153DE|nr:16S rRNA (uracil(1498)-N(3))-methyltransferase [Granulicatella sp. zg-84]NEW65977.1 16S rRNA (uracil(1498)-N(3))-methyltransferase [Granulicatella sp. zg-84]QMI85878.1 16S rRNA (uracil(1498)-N(3))-methyltransferase [Carnobacteriaceae bacterium zg-84]
MQRYFLDSVVNKDRIGIVKEQYHHMIRVMRMKVGQCVYLVEPNRRAFLAEITEIEDDVVWLTYIADDDRQVELPVDVTIACGLPKGDKLEFIAQKATELGVHSILPVETSWSVVKWEMKKQDKKIQRLQKIAQEAAEQSHRHYVPTIYPMMSFKQLINHLNDYTHVIVAYEESAKQSEMSQLKKIYTSLKPNDRLLAIFGSEGGLSPDEITLLEKAGATLCGLGPRIMRAETAPLYLLSSLSYALELGGN